MKRFILIIGVFFLCVFCEAQSIEKRYSSHLTENGTIHFFRPMKLDKMVNMDGFCYDMSYQSKGDTVIINCSLSVQNEAIVKNVTLRNDKAEVACYSMRMLYRDVTKKGYVLRITSKFPYSNIKEFFSNEKPFVFCFTLADESKSSATYKESKWKKERIQVTRIINSIDF